MSEKKLNSSVFASVSGLIALQKKARKGSMPRTQKQTLSGSGNTRSPFKTKGMDFAEVRAYQAGDDSRQIDWRVTAKYGKPYTKLYVDEKERPVFFLCDMRTAMKFASHGDFKSVVCAKIAAFLGWYCAAKGDSLRALILTPTALKLTAIGKGKDIVLPILKELSRASNPLHLASDEMTLEQAMARSLPFVQKGALVFVCSDFHDLTDACIPLVSKLANTGNLTFVHIYDEMEKELPNAFIPISNGTEAFMVDMTSKKNRSAYTAAFEKQQAFIKKVATTYGAACLEVTTRSDYIKTIILNAEGRL